jgi:hypothetical protein
VRTECHDKHDTSKLLVWSSEVILLLEIAALPGGIELFRTAGTTPLSYRSRMIPPQLPQPDDWREHG